MGKSKPKTKDERMKRRLKREKDQEYESKFSDKPHSLIFRRGKTANHIINLVADLRKVMAPYSAEKLKERAKNKLRDFLQVAGLYNVTHFLILSQTLLTTSLRIARVPRGPTLYLRVIRYSTMKDISRTKRPHLSEGIFQRPPLVVLNNFSGEEDHKKITAAIFQNMFPALDINTIHLKDCRRVVIFNYNSENDTIEFRHYVINVTPIGLTRSIRKVIKGKILKLHDHQDIADYVENLNTLSDSEAEVPEDSHVTLSESAHGRGNIRNRNSAVKLKEIGPRLTLQLTKIVDGVCEGATIYHKYITKTDKEIQELETRKIQEREIKLAALSALGTEGVDSEDDLDEDLIDEDETFEDEEDMDEIEA